MKTSRDPVVFFTASQSIIQSCKEKEPTLAQSIGYIGVRPSTRVLFFPRKADHLPRFENIHILSVIIRVVLLSVETRSDLYFGY